MKGIKRGLGFGVTSGIITTLGLMIGLYSGTNSKNIVLAGIIVIAVADALPDAFGMHISEELADKKTKEKQVWLSTISTFAFKLLTASILAIPILLMNLQTAIITSVILGIFMLMIFNYFIAKENNKKALPIIIEHLIITIVVIVITYFLGELISKFG
jgi:VIT1/CCC1 family predicted Fe2+/Mn2+ transporter